MTIKTYLIRIEAPNDADDEEISNSLNWLVEMNAIQDAEDAINDHLGEGYYCKIDDYNVQIPKAL